MVYVAIVTIAEIVLVLMSVWYLILNALNWRVARRHLQTIVELRREIHVIERQYPELDEQVARAQAITLVPQRI